MILQKPKPAEMEFQSDVHPGHILRLPDSESRLAITIEMALIIMGSIFKDYQDSERNCEPQLLPCLSQGEKK